MLFLYFLLFFSIGCSEYEIEEILQVVTPGPMEFDIPDDRVLLPPEKNINPPDGPVDLGDPLIPDIEVSFIQYHFGTIELTDPPLDVALEISNLGDYPLRISSITQSFVSNSFLLTPLSNMEILPGEMEILLITYLPTQYGPDGEQIKIESNDPDESSIIIQVAGSGATPILEIDPISIDFGNIDRVISGPVYSTINLENTGDGTVEITAVEELKNNLDIDINSHPSLILAPGQQTSMDVIYLPSDSGNDIEKIKFTSNDPSDPIQKVTIKGSTADPDINAVPTLDFGFVDIGLSTTKTVAIDNIGTGVLQVSGIYFSNNSSAFSIIQNFAGDITPGSWANIEIEYQPNDFIIDATTIEILSNDPDEPGYLIFLEGNGAVPEIDPDPLTINFGTLDVGNTSTKTLTINNTGIGTLQINYVDLVNHISEYSITATYSGPILPGGKEEIEIQYSPMGTINNADQVEISSNDPNNPLATIDLIGSSGIPDIELTPVIVDFGITSANSISTESFEIKNVGTGELTFQSISLVNNSSSFTILPPTFSSLAPGDYGVIDIEYAPIQYSPLESDSIEINSNDPDEPQAYVDLVGECEAPSIVIDPSNYDFGTGYLECEIEKYIKIKNVGSSPLEVSLIDYYATVPAYLDIDLNTAVNGAYPWNIDPLDELEVAVTYYPEDILTSSGILEVYSNDPVNPIEFAYQDAESIYYSSVLDSFTQSANASSDILFIVDNSCSMSTWQTHVANNFSSFINVFYNSAVDYQIGVISTDDEYLVGPVIDSNTADPVAEFQNQVKLGIYGSGIEMGLEAALRATALSASAGPGSTFFRNSTTLVMIFVSDERDWSTYGTYYTYPWTPTYLDPLDYAQDFEALKPPGTILVHAVAGDYPSGCNAILNGYNRYAQYGAGYYEVVNYFSGTFLSICDNDWGTKMETLANQSVLGNIFTLSDFPVESSIEVYIDGILDPNWFYDNSTNSVILQSPPMVNSIVDINYNIYGC